MIGWFGEPLKVVRMENGGERFEYFSQRQRESVEAFLLWRRKHVQTWDQRLTVRLVDNIVREHAYESRVLE